jgi:ankyrin repeat protein
VAELKRRSNHEAMLRAIDDGDTRALQSLIAGGAAVDDPGGDETGAGDFPITAAAAKGNLAAVDVLLKARANPNACCCSCITALHRAIEGGHDSVVARLLDGAADPRIRYEGRLSTLELANRSGHPEIVRRINEALAHSPQAR